ncbi:protein-L-isoaspartate(D-aspartate) O-methyltransferase [soil metagenome]
MTTRKTANWIASAPKRDDKTPQSRYSIAGRRVEKPARIEAATNASRPSASTSREAGSGLGSERQRTRMVERIAGRGVRDALVLQAVDRVPRDLFVEPGFASRAYEDSALPIGHGQTISQPFIVARMLEIMRNGRTLNRLLEVGTGCGYQAAVMAQIAPHVISIERIRALHEQARLNLRSLRLSGLRLHYGDGRIGYADGGPYDGIVMAAVGSGLPQPLLEQLAIGGRLIAPVTGPDGDQRLVCVDRRGPKDWQSVEMDVVHFVPLRSGTSES